MKKDSVFDREVKLTFATDRAIIPRKKIVQDMRKIENAMTLEMMRLFEREVNRLMIKGEKAVENGNVAGVAALDWNLSVTLQNSIFEVWDRGWRLGEEHGIESERKAVPPTIKKEALESRLSKFAEPDILAAVRNLFNIAPIGIRNTRAEQAVIRRSLRLAGDFASDTLNRLKGDLIAAIVPQPETGEPISRETLLERIQGTLGVTQNRASAIARTETTSAYNNGRVESYRQSRLVTHYRFLAISDDRTTDICRSRNGMVMDANDFGLVDENTPPLHINCRSIISPLMPAVNKSHNRMASDPARRASNKKLFPLPPGWNS